MKRMALCQCLVATSGVALLTTTACAPADDPNRINVAIIGATPRLGDPDREPLDATRRLLMRETAMGLVAFDAGGQIEPAIAERWIVTDDGRSIIFRLRRLSWPDGREVTGPDVAASLNRSLATASKNRLKPLLTAVEAVIGMTGRVVEIRLKAPRPNLLQLLAQPELGIRRNGQGLGPWRIAGRAGDALILRPVPDPIAPIADGGTRDARRVTLKAGRPALAVARFIHGDADIVLGGTLADWPIATASGLVRTARLRRDPAEGLLGLEILPRSALLRERVLREALAMAIDREKLGDDLAITRWTVVERLLPAQLDSGQSPATPSWAGTSLTERRATASRRVASWKAARGPIQPLRVALPAGPGMQILFARLSADWRRIGVPSEMVPLADAKADLRLVDEVAPNNSANWYLTRTSCAYAIICSTVGTAAIGQARAAATLGQRSVAIAQADTANTQTAAYIPLGKPLRWSLVGDAATGYRDNIFAAHPIAELRAPTAGQASR